MSTVKYMTVCQRENDPTWYIQRLNAGKESDTGSTQKEKQRIGQKSY